MNTEFFAPLNLCVHTAANLTVALCAYWTYTKIPLRAFRLWFISSAIFVLLTVFNWTVAVAITSQPVFVVLAQLAQLAAVIIGITGTILFIRDYLASPVRPGLR